MSTRIGAALLLVLSLAGLVFASVSTFDFVQHLDRQVHDLHCSFVPGLVESDEGSSGCQVTLLSPYSSVMRTSLWGGVPISLGAMTIFALLAYRAAELFGRPVGERKTSAAITLALVSIPVVASIVMGTIAIRELDAVCKLCVGIYVCSGGLLLTALATWRSASREDELGRPAPTVPVDDASEPSPPPAPTRAGPLWLAAAGQLFAFTAVPIVSYAMLAPDHGRFVGTCGGLTHPQDSGDVFVSLHGTGKTEILEVFDPLCPACRGLSERLDASEMNSRLSRTAVLFPLDSECNWMVDRSLHPGACRVSKAVLCADEVDSVSVSAVVDWAFEHQTELTKLGESDPDAVTKQIAAQFGGLKACLGSAEVEARLNRSLRWIVANELPVLTPQVFLDGVKLCDEDTDLGLDFALDRMLELHDAGTLASLAPEPDAEDAFVPGSEAPPRPDDKAPRSRKPAAKPVAKPEPKPKPAEPAPDQPEPDAPEPSADDPKPAPSKGLPSVEELPDQTEDQTEDQEDSP